ncbi:MAG: glutaredoxin family protein [Anaerolineae bacterium]|nr:glutaredoxin family protein [Anaerolineae bacterium]MCO5205434.1 glutaredoxin family protein [Anaerolineae bacterium]
MLRITLYTKEDCTLCDMVKVQLRMFRRMYPHELTEVDIAQDHELLVRYRFQIPVLEIDGGHADTGSAIVLKAPISTVDLATALRSASGISP